MDLFKEPQPIWVVNDYIWAELKKLSPIVPENTDAENLKTLEGMWLDKTPFFPVNDSTSGQTQWLGKPYFIYNQAFRIEHSFYEIKKATFVYSMRATPAQTIPLSTALQKIMDRDDDAAKDINDFNLALGEDGCPVYFHSFSLYQNEPAKPRDGSVEPFVVSNFMVVAKYHLLTPDPITP